MAQLVPANRSDILCSPHSHSPKPPRRQLHRLRNPRRRLSLFLPTASPQAAKAIHNSALVIDTHADTPGRFVDENFDLSQDAGHGYMDFDKIKAGNLGAEFFSIWVDPKDFKGKEIRRALDMIDSVYEQARLHPDKMMMAFSTPTSLRRTASTNWRRSSASREATRSRATSACCAIITASARAT